MLEIYPGNTVMLVLHHMILMAGTQVNNIQRISFQWQLPVPSVSFPVLLDRKRVKFPCGSSKHCLQFSNDERYLAERKKTKKRKYCVQVQQLW